MQKRWNVTLFAALLVCSLAAPPTIDSETIHPNQRITVSVADTYALDSSNTAVANAALGIVLSSSNLKCEAGSQLQSIIESYAQSALEALSKKISGTTCLKNGAVEHLETAFMPNGAIRPEQIISPLIEGDPLLLKWKGTFFVLYGVVYDEHVHRSGGRNNVIRELLLIDPRYQDNRRFVVFDREKNNFGEVEGMVKLTLKRS
jgi:hypothetical protein